MLNNTKKTNGLIYVQNNKQKTKYDIQQQTTTTELQAFDFGQAHTECCRVKLF